MISAQRSADQLMGETHEPDRAFHYLLQLLLRGLCFHLPHARNRSDAPRISTSSPTKSGWPPHYFLNVPMPLERVRRGVEERFEAPE
jgi:hypothetical protein